MKVAVVWLTVVLRSLESSWLRTAARIQNPEDDECAVVTEYLRLMALDSSATVREAAVASRSICITQVLCFRLIALSEAN